MCRRAHCSGCGKLTWAGCGQHAEQVLAGVPATDRCACEPRPPTTSRVAALVRRAFGAG